MRGICIRLLNILIDGLGRIAAMFILLFIGAYLYKEVSEFWSGVFAVFVLVISIILIVTSEDERKY